MKSVRNIGVVVLAVLVIASCAFGAEGGLSGEAIEEIRGSFEMDAHTRAMYNSITNNDISGLALNRDIMREHNALFSHKIKTKDITNQKSSGRCWLFAGLNVLRPAALEKYKLKEFELSQNYLTFWDKLEKANCFLENIIEFRKRDMMDREMEFILRDPVPDGGYWENVVNLVEKYGVVPSRIMPETNSSGNTALMNALIGRKLRADAVKLRRMAGDKNSVKKLRVEKVKMLGEVYKMLVMNLGEPPKQFEWRFEDANSVVSEVNEYTPKSFFEEFMGVDVRQYVDVFNDPSKEYGRHYSIDLTRNIRDGQDNHFANVKIEALKEIASKAVLDDEPVWFGCDVGKDQSREHGIMAMGMFDYDSIYGTDMSMSKAERSLFRESVPNHAMVFVGVDMREGKPAKWLVENSWGKEKGSEGMWTLYDTWFDTNVYSVIVKKKYVPEEVLKIFEQPAERRPPWDPAWALVQ
ncbi:MAG TPA: C1 family peptidase [Sedimentisphaerales bacterium]|nr:C1 family peptidase [Sedimentisphaerales bacterium]